MPPKKTQFATEEDEKRVRKMVIDFLKAHKPSDLHMAEKYIYAPYTEQEIWRKLHERYEVQLPSGTGDGDVQQPAAAVALRKKLVEFYSKYGDPAQVDEKVETAMRQTIPEDQLWQKLYKKYNLDENGNPRDGGDQPPPSTAAPAASEDPREALRKKLVEFYSKYGDPAQVDEKVETAMRQTIPEDQLWQKLYRKYDLDEEGNPVQQPVATPHLEEPAPTTEVEPELFYTLDEIEDCRQRMTRFYRHYAPHKLESVEKNVAKYSKVKDGYTRMWTTLENNYGPEADVGQVLNEPSSAELNNIIDEAMEGPEQPLGPTSETTRAPEKPAASAPEAAESVERAQLRQYLTEFYQRFHKDSAEVATKVDSAMDLGIPQEALMPRLYKKYSLDVDGQPLVEKPPPVKAQPSTIPEDPALIQEPGVDPSIIGGETDHMNKFVDLKTVNDQVSFRMELRQYLAANKVNPSEIEPMINSSMKRIQLGEISREGFWEEIHTEYHPRSTSHDTAENKPQPQLQRPKLRTPRAPHVDSEGYPVADNDITSTANRSNASHRFDKEGTAIPLSSPLSPADGSAKSQRKNIVHPGTTVVVGRLLFPSADLRLFVQASDSQRQAFYIALEADFTSFASNLGAASSSIGLINRQDFELPVEIHFASSIMAKSAMSKVKSHCAVPIPQTRLSYVTMRGRPSDIQFAVLSDLLKDAPLEPMEAATPAAASPPALFSTSSPGRQGQPEPRDALDAVVDFASSVEKMQRAFPQSSGYTRLADVEIQAASPDRSATAASFSASRNAFKESFVETRLAEVEERERKVNARWRELTVRETVLQDKMGLSPSHTAASVGSSSPSGKTDQLLALREHEMYEKERQATKKLEELEEQERRVQRLLGEVAQREIHVAEKEAAVSQREQHVINRETVLLTQREPSPLRRESGSSPHSNPPGRQSSGGEEFSKATEEYIVKLEKDIRELHAENARLKQGAVDASVQLRMEQVIERENRLKQSEAKLQATIAEAYTKSREGEENLQRRIEAVVDKEKQLAAPSLEVQLQHSEVMARAREDPSVSATDRPKPLTDSTLPASPAHVFASPSRSQLFNPAASLHDLSGGTQLSPHGSPRGVIMPQTTSSRSEEVASMMRRVREKEIVLRNVSEQQRLRSQGLPSRSANPRFSFY